jgi:hypothetical protein
LSVELERDGSSPCGTAGDVIRNGSITMSDALTTAQFALGLTQITPQQQLVADVSDALPAVIVTMSDALLIAQYSLEIVHAFPSCAI